MKKAILVEPKLLAKIKQKSPAVYEYYCNSPFTMCEFVDYGEKGIHMFIQKGVLDMLEPLKDDPDPYYSGFLTTLKCGYILGRHDMQKKYNGFHTSTVKLGVLVGDLLNLALNYPCYDDVDLLNTDNFGTIKGFAYSKCTYKEAQYFGAWEALLPRHQLLNNFFIDINKKREREGLQNLGYINYTADFN